MVVLLGMGLLVLLVFAVVTGLYTKKVMCFRCVRPTFPLPPFPSFPTSHSHALSISVNFRPARISNFLCKPFDALTKVEDRQLCQHMRPQQNFEGCNALSSVLIASNSWLWGNLFYRGGCTLPAPARAPDWANVRARTARRTLDLQPNSFWGSTTGHFDL